MKFVQFEEYPSTARLFRECVITEKIDGVNSQIYITDGGVGAEWPESGEDTSDALAQHNGLFLYAGSRNRWITPAADGRFRRPRLCAML